MFAAQITNMRSTHEIHHNSYSSCIEVPAERIPEKTGVQNEQMDGNTCIILLFVQKGFVLYREVPGIP